MLENIQEDLLTWNPGKSNASKPMLAHCSSMFGVVVREEAVV